MIMISESCCSRTSKMIFSLKVRLEDVQRNYEKRLNYIFYKLYFLENQGLYLN